MVTLPRRNTRFRAIFDACMAGPKTVVQIANELDESTPDVTSAIVDLRQRGLLERCGTVKAPYVKLGLYQLTEAAWEAAGVKSPAAAIAA